MHKKLKLNMSVGVKASVAYFLASVISKGIAYITTPIYTRLLTSAEYGKTSVFLTWQQIFGIVAMFNLSHGVFNNGMSDYKNKRDEYSYSMLVLSNCITIVTGILLFAGMQLFGNFLNLEYPFIVLMFAIFMVEPAYNFWKSKQRYEYQYSYPVIWSVVQAVIYPLIAIAIIKLHAPGDRLYARIFGSEIPMFLVFLGFYLYIGQKNKWHLNTSYWKYAFMFNLPLLPHYLSSYLLSSSDKIMISHLVGDTSTAYYSVAYSVAAVGTIVWTAINGSLIPYTYKKCEEKDYAAINRVTLPILYLFASCCIFIIILAPEVVKIMATKEYHEAIYVIPPIVGGVFFQVQYFVFANILYYYKKPKYVMYGSLVATFLNLLLNYIFIRIFGYIAAAYTTLLCYLIQAIIDYYAMRKAVPEKVYDIKTISWLSFGIIIIALISNFIYDYYIIRYAFLIALLATVYVFRKKILNIMKLIKAKT